MVIGLVCSMLSILFGGRMVTAGLVRAPWLSRGEVLILAPVGSQVVRDDPLAWCWPDGGNLWLLAGSSTCVQRGNGGFPPGVARCSAFCGPAATVTAQ
jgi:predicted tellurium resistance membrane protein TerC